jgi:hypothetical protein
LVALLDEDEGHASPGQVEGQRKAGRARAAYQDIGIERHWQLRKSTCNMHVYSGGRRGKNKSA